MKALFQDLRNGKTIVQNVPAPIVQDGHILIRNLYSVISTGTEKMLGSFGKASLLGKARMQPERVAEVFRKAKNDGWKATYRAVQSKLSQPIPIGYAAAGIVEAVGKNIAGISVGDLVASNAAHAEGAIVPKHLCVKVPPGVPADVAAFTVPGAIALQGIRLVAPQLGEIVVVLGLGLIGQLTVQLLKASGCIVIGADISARAIDLAAPWCHTTVLIGKDDLVTAAAAATAGAGAGADAVIITTATDSDEPVHTAAAACRKRGRIILVGTAGLHLSRAGFFKKELTFQVSCSYGPGRYDPQYETYGADYPVGFVRWTEHRNMQAVLQAMASGSLQTSHLVGNTISIEAYDAALRAKDTAPKATLIKYSADAVLRRSVTYSPVKALPAKGTVAVIGAGAFASGILLPAMQAAGLSVGVIASRNGSGAALSAKRFSIPTATTDVASILQDDSIATVCIAVRPDAAAALVAAALQNGRNVFVEKPLATDLPSLIAIENTAGAGGWLHVGYNRRFAPLLTEAQKHIPAGVPLFIRISVNAGMLPDGHWAGDESAGGGRIISEGCHFADIAAAIAGSPITAVSAQAFGTPDTDNFSMSLRFANGSTAGIHYFSGGAARYPKEHIEVHGGGKSILLKNWQQLDVYTTAKATVLKRTQDKGQKGQWDLLAALIKNGGAPLIPFTTIINSARAVILAKESMRSGGGWLNL